MPFLIKSADIFNPGSVTWFSISHPTPPLCFESQEHHKDSCEYLWRSADGETMQPRSWLGSAEKTQKSTSCGRRWSISTDDHIAAMQFLPGSRLIKCTFCIHLSTDLPAGHRKCSFPNIQQTEMP